MNAIWQRGLAVIVALFGLSTVSAHTLDAQQKLALCGEEISAIGGDGGDACMRAASTMTMHTYILRIEIDGKSHTTAVEDGQMQAVRASDVGVEVVPKGVDASGRVSLTYHVVVFSDDKDGFGHGLLPAYALLPVGITAKTESLAGHQIAITVESIHD